MGLMILPVWVAQPLIRKEDVNHKSEPKREIEEDVKSASKKVKHCCSGKGCTQNPSLKCEFKQCKSCCWKFNSGDCEIHKKVKRIKPTKPSAAVPLHPNVEQIEQNKGTSWCCLM
jgi:hypothetical protein